MNFKAVALVSYADEWENKVNEWLGRIAMAAMQEPDSHRIPMVTEPSYDGPLPQAHHLMHDGEGFRMVPVPKVTNAYYILHDEEKTMQAVAGYVRQVETEPYVCACMFEIHPDDVNKSAGQPRRKRLIQPSLECAQHSREGFLLGFVAYLKGSSVQEYTTSVQERDKRGGTPDEPKGP